MDSFPSPAPGALPSAGYILGVGTNLDPENSAAHIVTHLAAEFGRVLLSRFYYTDPVGMTTRHRFVNFCAFVPSEFEPAACKAMCVGIEIAMGRDRAHPACKTRDRVADLDLIARLDTLMPPPDPDALPVDSYLIPPFRELLAVLAGRHPPGPAGTLCPVPFPGFGPDTARLGEAPAAVHRDDGTGLVRILENGFDRDPDRFDPALLAEERL